MDHSDNTVPIPFGSWLCEVGGMNVGAEGLIPRSDPVASNTTASVRLPSVGLASPLSLFRARRSFHGEGRSWNHMSLLGQGRWCQRNTATTGRSKTGPPSERGLKPNPSAEGLVSDVKF